MTSEAHIQLESASALVSSDNHHDTHVQTAPSVPEPMTNSRATELPSQTHEADLSAVSTTVLDRTLVEGDDPNAPTEEHAVPSASSISAKGHVSKRSRDSHSTRQDGSVEGGSPWHPLHSMELTSKGGKTQDYNPNMPQTDMTLSNRTSHFHLNLKSSSPQPWDHIGPPLENNLKSMEGYYSPSTQQKFRTMQKTSEPRPLIPQSSYYFGPPPPDSAYGTAPTGHIGVHHPREILRVERDYTGGELIQFAPIYPLELEGRITPTQFLESINSINELLISAHSLRHSFLDNILAIFSLQISRLFLTTHFEKEMRRLRHLIDDLNIGTFNPVGLNMLWPRNVAFLYLEIEYYVSDPNSPICSV